MRNKEHIDRRLFKERYIRGAIRTANASGDKVAVESSSGIGFEKIKITGHTEHREKSLTEILSQRLSDNNSYISAEMSGAFAYELPDGWKESRLTFQPVLEGETSMNVYLADSSSFFFSSSQPLLLNGEVSTFSGSGYGYIIISGAVDPADIQALWSVLKINVSKTGEFYGKSEYSIVNAGQEGMNVVLSSKNLLDHSLFISTSYCGVKLEPNGSEIHMTGTGNKYIYICPFFHNPDEKMTLPENMKVKTLTACAYYDDASCRSEVEIGFYDSTGENSFLWAVLNNNYKAISMNSSWDRLWLRIRFYEDIEYDTKIRIMLFEGTEKSMPEFVPYFEPKEICLPSEAVDSNGNSVSLSFAGYEGARDYLEVDRKSGRVLYYRLVGEQDTTKSENEQELLESPVIYDLTSNAFAKELLSLNVPYKCSGILKASGASEISVRYFATKGQDEAALTIRYMCDGEEIQESSGFNMRKGSFYDVLYPHITGYIASGERCMGHAHDDTEIILTYRKDSV